MGSTYRGVVYHDNGAISITKAYSNQAAAFYELLELMKKRKWHDHAKRTTVIKRDAKAGEFIFGQPKSLDAKAAFDDLLKRGLAQYEE